MSKNRSVYVSPIEGRTYCYINQNGPFRIVREFRDFERLTLTTLVGYDGDIEVVASRGNFILFARDRDEIGGRCFVLIPEDKLRVK